MGIIQCENTPSFPISIAQFANTVAETDFLHIYVHMNRDNIHDLAPLLDKICRFSIFVIVSNDNNEVSFISYFILFSFLSDLCV